MAKKVNENEILIREDEIQYLLIGGVKYELPKMTLSLMRKIEDHFDIGIRQIGDLLIERSATTSLRLIHFLIKQKGASISEEDLGDLIAYKDMTKVGEAIAKVLTGE